MTDKKLDISTQAGRWLHLINGGKLIKSDSTIIVSLKNGQARDLRDFRFDLTDNVWSIYEEPKPKVKLYQFAYKYNKKWERSSIFYKDEDDFKKSNPNLSKSGFMRLDNSMIEVDDE